jgi:hypothetical protein
MENIANISINLMTLFRFMVVWTCLFERPNNNYTQSKVTKIIQSGVAVRAQMW